MNTQHDYGRKMVSLDSALEFVKHHQTVVTAMAACEPRGFFQRIASHAQKVEGLTVFCANPSESFECFTDSSLEGKLELAVMFLTSSVRKNHGHGVVHYYPQHLSRWVRNITSGREIDVFWGTCSLPDSRGFVSLGLSACYEPEILARAKTVILEVNRHMPVTFGNTQVPISRVTAFVENHHPLLTIDHQAPTAEEVRIGQWVADLVPSESTIQLGIGAIPQAVGVALEGKRDLGVHTEMFNDSLARLFDIGVVTNSRKTIWPGKMVGTFALGSEKLYALLANNPMVEFQPASVVNDPYRIARNHRMHSINTAVEVDLTGQCCSESLGHVELSGVGGAADTHVGAQLSDGGRGIIALRSTTADGRHSKIVFELRPGAKVSISRNDIDTVVTEYGVAQLRGKSVAQRVKAMCQIAHPQFRADLEQSARKVGYL